MQEKRQMRHFYILIKNIYTDLHLTMLRSTVRIRSSECTFSYITDSCHDDYILTGKVSRQGIRAEGYARVQQTVAGRQIQFFKFCIWPSPAIRHTWSRGTGVG